MFIALLIPPLAAPVYEGFSIAHAATRVAQQRPNVRGAARAILANAAAANAAAASRARVRDTRGGGRRVRAAATTAATALTVTAPTARALRSGCARAAQRGTARGSGCRGRGRRSQLLRPARRQRVGGERGPRGNQRHRRRGSRTQYTRLVHQAARKVVELSRRGGEGGRFGAQA